MYVCTYRAFHRSPHEADAGARFAPQNFGDQRVVRHVRAKVDGELLTRVCLEEEIM